MKSSSLHLIDAGIKDPKKYRDSLIHDWYLDEQYSKHLTVYILRESPTGEFFLHVKDGELFVKSKPYSVIWINSPAIIRENPHVLISLRYCQYLKRGYALVKVLEGDRPFELMEYK